jgi:hypothetical protein
LEDRGVGSPTHLLSSLFLSAEDIGGNEFNEFFIKDFEYFTAENF